MLKISILTISNQIFPSLKKYFIMKKIILFTFSSLLVLSIVAFNYSPNEVEISSTEIKWYTLEEAIQANQKSEKKFFIDFYTDWCGWCKVMDQKTFTNPEVIKYMNENFYAVKFNAEQRAPMTFKGKKYEFIPGGRRGIHGLAYKLLNQNASYPSFVVLDTNLNRQNIIKGYKAPQPFLEILNKQSF